MRRYSLTLLVILCLVIQVAAQNNYTGFYGDGLAGGVYTSVNGGPETGPELALVSVARTNTSVYAMSSTNLTTTNWLSVGTVQTLFVSPNLYYYFDPSSTANSLSTVLSNLYVASGTHPRVWFSTNASGIWILRATNSVVVGSVTNTYRLEVFKTREQRPTLVSPNESPLNYGYFERADAQPYIGSVNGDGLSYQWQRSDLSSGPWTNVPSATNPTATNDYLVLAAIAPSDGGYYRKYIYNSGGSVTSTWVNVSVIAGPPSWSFGVLGAGLTNKAGYPGLVSPGSSVLLSISINNTTKHWGYWRKNGTPMAFFSRATDGTLTVAQPLIWTNASGGNANISAYSASYLIPTDSGNWDCVVNDAWGRSMTSSVYRVLITNAPGGPTAITREPLDRTNAVNGTVILTAGATGAPPVSVQWFRENGTPLIAATNYLNVTTTNLQINYLSPADAIGYYMVATDLNGTTATSRTARVTVATPPTFLLQPVDATGTEGGFVSFSALGTANVPFTYQWLYNGSINSSSATNPTYAVSNLLATQNKAITVSVQLVSQFHTVVSTQAVISVNATGLVAKLQGREWTRVLDTDTRVPGYTSFFSTTNETFRGRWNTALRPRMTLKNGTLHMAVPAGVYYYSNQFVSGYAAQSALVRWRSNQLDLLVYTNTTIPGTSDKFLTVFYPTDEEAGVMNFVGFGNSSRGVYGFRNGAVENAVPSLTTPYSDGPGFFDGSGQLVRRGTNLLFASNSTDRKAGSANTQVGMFLWDGASFTTLLNENSDLPGAAGPFQGVGVAGFAGDAFAYDGTNIVANIISSGTNAGVYLINGNGVTKLADKTDARPGTTALFTSFGPVSIRDGSPRFVAQNTLAYAYTPLGQLTNIGSSTLVPAPKPGQTATLSANQVRRVNVDGSSSFVLTSPPNWLIDGRRVQTVYNVVADGDDVAIDVQFTDGSSGVYFMTLPQSAPTAGTPVTISPVVIAGGFATFTFPTQAGRYYRVEFSTGLPTWSYLSFLVGDGNTATVQTASVTSGNRYYRVIELP